jgi:hypothetical protein
MTSQRINPHNLLFRVPSNDDYWFSLSHSFAQMPESDPVAGVNVLLYAISGVRHGHMMGNRLDLFLDFTEKFPHSNLQTDTHDD